MKKLILIPILALFLTACSEDKTYDPWTLGIPSGCGEPDRIAMGLHHLYVLYDGLDKAAVKYSLEDIKLNFETSKNDTLVGYNGESHGSVNVTFPDGCIAYYLKD